MSGAARETVNIVLIGGGVHAVVVADCVACAGGANIAGYCDAAGHDATHMERIGVPWLGEDGEIAALVRNGRAQAAILGMAGLEHRAVRVRVAERLTEAVPLWWTAVHPRSVVAESATVGAGTAVLAGAVINALARIGSHCVINTSAAVEHHCTVEDFAVVSPRVTLCGGVRVGRSAFLGAGAVVLGGLSVGAGSTVGAGAVVLHDVPAGATVVGNPARPIRRRSSLPYGQVALVER